MNVPYGVVVFVVGTAPTYQGSRDKRIGLGQPSSHSAASWYGRSGGLGRYAGRNTMREHEKIKPI